MYLSNLSKTFQNNRSFYIAFGIIWLTGLYFQLTIDQLKLSQVINATNTTANDFAMKYLTYAGDGIFVALMGTVIIAIDRKLWLITLLCLAIPSVITQLLKHFVFEDHNRPAIVMAHISGLHYIRDVSMNQYNSFPSGHTTAAFSLYTLMALLTPNKKWGFAWILVATCVAISRVYLLQHFWQDIIAGALIGTAICTLIFAFFVPKPDPLHATKE